MNEEFPLQHSGLMIPHAVSVEMWVQSLAWHSGLSIWSCCSCGISCSAGWDLIPRLGTSICLICFYMPKQTNKQTNKQKRINEWALLESVNGSLLIKWKGFMIWNHDSSLVIQQRHNICLLFLFFHHLGLCLLGSLQSSEVEMSKPPPSQKFLWLVLIFPHFLTDLGQFLVAI